MAGKSNKALLKRLQSAKSTMKLNGTKKGKRWNLRTFVKSNEHKVDEAINIEQEIMIKYTKPKSAEKATLRRRKRPSSKVFIDITSRQTYHKHHRDEQLENVDDSHVCITTTSSHQENLYGSSFPEIGLKIPQLLHDEIISYDKAKHLEVRNEGHPLVLGRDMSATLSSESLLSSKGMASPEEAVSRSQLPVFKQECGIQSPDRSSEMDYLSLCTLGGDVAQSGTCSLEGESAKCAIECVDTLQSSSGHDSHLDLTTKDALQLVYDPPSEQPSLSATTSGSAHAVVAMDGVAIDRYGLEPFGDHNDITSIDGVMIGRDASNYCLHNTNGQEILSNECLKIDGDSSQLCSQYAIGQENLTTQCPEVQEIQTQHISHDDPDTNCSKQSDITDWICSNSSTNEGMKVEIDSPKGASEIDILPTCTVVKSFEPSMHNGIESSEDYTDDHYKGSQHEEEYDIHKSAEREYGNDFEEESHEICDDKASQAKCQYHNDFDDAHWGHANDYADDDFDLT
ncbi:hypothetical protein AC1031_013292 [Aphanomyces cochlioides]|nr:hypothetical protein AC1031_013292 [Aphanomyces cochlioides]